VDDESWWALQDLNLGPIDYESTALTAELRALRTATSASRRRETRDGKPGDRRDVRRLSDTGRVAHSSPVLASLGMFTCHRPTNKTTVRKRERAAGKDEVPILGNTAWSMSKIDQQRLLQGIAVNPYELSWGSAHQLRSL
jgi:hypothetical protein